MVDFRGKLVRVTNTVHGFYGQLCQWKTAKKTLVTVHEMLIYSS